MKRCILIWAMLAFLSFGEEGWSELSLSRLKKAARGGEAAAQLELGRRYAEADGGINSIDLEDAFKWYLKAAEKGVAEAQWRVAKAYEDGLGVVPDAREEDRWFLVAAEQGHLAARMKLCRPLRMRLKKMFDADEYDRLVAWCREEADKGFAEACALYLTVCNRNKSLSPQPEQVTQFVVPAMEFDPRGLAWYQTVVGDAYVASENYAEALRWYKRVYTNEWCDFKAFKKIGDLYRDGKGVEQSDAEALRWYESGIDALGPDKLSGSYYRELARMVSEGFGTEPDKQRAAELMAQADEADRLQKERLENFTVKLPAKYASRTGASRRTIPQEEIQEPSGAYRFTDGEGNAYDAVLKSYSTSSQTVMLKTVGKQSLKKIFTEFTRADQASILDWKADDIVASGRIRVKTDLRRMEPLKTRTHSSFGDNVDVEPVQYALQVTNRERIPVSGLTLHYYLVYELGGTKGIGVNNVPEGLDFLHGTIFIEELPAGETRTFETDVLKLETRKSAYTGYNVGDWDSSGSGSSGGGTTKEELKGIVVRMFRKGRLLREESEPGTLAKRVREDDGT